MSTPTYNPYTPTTSAAYVAHFAPLPYFPALTQHYASLSQQDHPSHHPPELHQPDLTTIPPPVASRVLRSFLAYHLSRAGFDSAHESAMSALERHLIAFLEHLFGRTHNYANLANRAGPIAPDLLLACQDLHIPLTDLRKLCRKSAKKNRKTVIKPSVLGLLPAPPRLPSPDLLPSDDEESSPMMPLTLRGLPNHFPELPPKHTYLRTPASPPKRAALPSLEKKLKTAALVQESLKNLLIATEENINQEDAELLGHVVNWEMGMHPRKRWKAMKFRRS
ncbi:hypothetical protein M378DRAFT_158877 [Amanita muscaria Koide BX008]|uniref:Transcription initiation factor TFIID subunit 8 n=1 Tax=Amanita muscaria (strain Koide BX008) TaxID=946122 RepID=A0A0C2XHB0_AMAMK|nr:hypothetical protein M378DRAFT_158877 [Amanita muscaria Koide BX008]